MCFIQINILRFHQSNCTNDDSFVKLAFGFKPQSSLYGEWKARLARPWKFSHLFSYTLGDMPDVRTRHVIQSVGKTFTQYYGASNDQITCSKRLFYWVNGQRPNTRQMFQIPPANKPVDVTSLKIICFSLISHGWNKRSRQVIYLKRNLCSHRNFNGRDTLERMHWNCPFNLIYVIEMFINIDINCYVFC